MPNQTYHDELIAYIRNVAKSDNPPSWRLDEIIRVAEQAMNTSPTKPEPGEE